MSTKQVHGLGVGVSEFDSQGCQCVVVRAFIIKTVFSPTATYIYMCRLAALKLVKLAFQHFSFLSSATTMERNSGKKQYFV